MAPTEYPINYVYAGAAQPLTLSTGIADTGGDLNIEVSDDATAKGWPTLGANEFIVVVVGRGTAYESKYLVKSISAQQGGGTLLVVDADDKAYDDTPVTAAPSGSLVEHCLSATEMSLANDHMRTKQAHGSDGDLVDQDSTQTLTNKTLTAAVLTAPVISGLAAADANGEPVRYNEFTTVQTTADNALPKAGGKMTGDLEIEKADAAVTLDAASGDTPGIILQKGGVTRYTIKLNTTIGGVGAMTFTRHDSGGTAVDTPLQLVLSNGHVISASHIGGKTTATTGSNGELTLTLPTSPTGNWAVTVTGTSIDGSGGTGYGQLFYVTATTSSSATVRVARSSTGAYINNTSVTFLYTAVAY